MDCKQVKEKLDAFVLKVLTSSENEEIEQHLKNCDSCRKAFKDAVQAMEALRALPGIEPMGGYADKALSRRKKKKKSYAWTIPAVAFLVLCFWFVWSFIQYYTYHPYSQLVLLSNGIWKYHEEHRHFPEPTKLSQSIFKNKYVPKDIYILDERGNILDFWGTPYVYKIFETSTSFKIYSCGKNRIDENGEGDDIVLIPTKKKRK